MRAYLIWADVAGVKSPYGSKTFSKMIDERLGKGVNHNSRPKHSKDVGDFWTKLEIAERRSRPSVGRYSTRRTTAPTAAEIRSARAGLPRYPEPEFVVKYSFQFKLTTPPEQVATA
jgi:hypothetical protein